jgi:hypothetical protein
MPFTEFAKRGDLIISNFDELKVSRIGKMAKAEGLSFKDTSNTFWWRICLDDEDIGLCGLIKANSDTWRMKSDFVLPEWRRQGFNTLSVWIRSLKAFEVGGTWAMSITRPSSGAALKKMGWTNEDSKKDNIFRMNVKNLFDGVDLSRDTIDLLFELCPGVSDG